MTRQKNPSFNLHARGNRTLNSNRPPFSKKIILAVILFASITVIVATLCSIFLTKENLIKSRISSLASDYYENNLYANFSQSEPFQNSNDLQSLMSKYEKYGFAPVTLRQLLSQKKDTSDITDYLSKNCDINATSIKYYIEPPYGQHDYRTEYTYSCNF